MAFLNLIAPSADNPVSPQPVHLDNRVAESEQGPFEALLSGAMDDGSEHPSVDEPAENLEAVTEDSGSTEELNELAAEIDLVLSEEALALPEEAEAANLPLIRKIATKQSPTGIEGEGSSEASIGPEADLLPLAETAPQPSETSLAKDEGPMPATKAFRLPRQGLLASDVKPPVALATGRTEPITEAATVMETAPEMPLAEAAARGPLAAAPTPELAAADPVQEVSASERAQAQVKAMPLPQTTPLPLPETEQLPLQEPAAPENREAPVKSALKTTTPLQTTMEVRPAARSVNPETRLDPYRERSLTTESGPEVRTAEDTPPTEPAMPRLASRETDIAGVQPNRGSLGPQESRVVEGGSELRSMPGQRSAQPRELPKQTLRIVQEMKSSGQSSYRAEIRLDPPELGRIRIELNVEGERAWARLVVESAAAREQVQSELPRIRELLESQGLEEARVEVQLRKDDAREQQAGRDGGRDAEGEHGIGDGDPEAGSRIRLSEHDGLIDLRA